MMRPLSGSGTWLVRGHFSGSQTDGVPREREFVLTEEYVPVSGLWLLSSVTTFNHHTSTRRNNDRPRFGARSRALVVARDIEAATKREFEDAQR